MIRYFTELLSTLKKIEKHLETLANCVYKNNRHGDSYSVSTKHWND